MTAMQQQWFSNILELVPEHLKDLPGAKDTVTEVFTEIKDDFDLSMKKSMGKTVYLY